MRPPRITTRRLMTAVAGAALALATVGVGPPPGGRSGVELSAGRARVGVYLEREGDGVVPAYQGHGDPRPPASASFAMGRGCVYAGWARVPYVPAAETAREGHQ